MVENSPLGVRGMRIFPLSEGSFTIDKTKVFVPFNNDTDKLQERTTGSLLVEVQPFAIVTPRDVLLIDTGLGFEIEGEMQIHNNLKNAGIDPSSVTKVLMSHLHKDHAGGITRKNSLGQYELSFPDATYYVQQNELNYALKTGFPSFVPEEFELLSNNANVEILNGDGIIDGYIEYKVSGAHSPFHQVFWIEKDGQKIFFGGDVAPQIQQMKSKFIAKYDYDGRKCMELRKEWWEDGQKNNWTFLFYHDIKQPVWSSSAKSF
ncbi:MAG TPA: MBL fold metallo-hydrolase [Segetibacter sp.]|jgi:glyoxylase-like metal-dependent hydrolase (beta-lactamase superfamily II)